MICAEQLRARYPQDFMMVQEDHKPSEATIWVRLPDPSLKTMFPDFTEGQIATLTARPIKLVVEDAEFNRAFEALPSWH
jgi:hypothetical protein